MSAEPLLDYEGLPYPESVQQVRALMLPSIGVDADKLLVKALRDARSHENNKPPAYSCTHCRDGKDLPEGYVCQRCGADNPGRHY